MTTAATPARAAHLRNAGVIPYLALLLVFGAAFSWMSWQAERERELKALSALVELGATSLDAYFAQIEGSLRVLSGELSGAGGHFDSARAVTALGRYKEVYSDLRILVVSRTDGQLLATSESAPGAKLPTLSGEPSFVLSRDELMRGTTLSVGRPFLGPVSGDWIIPLRYGARDAGGNLVLLVGAGLPLSRTHVFWKDAPLPPDAALGILRDDSFLVSRYPVPARFELAEVYGKPRGGPLVDALERQNFPVRGTIEGPSGLSGANTVFVFRRLSHYPLTLYVANPVANLWAAWWQKVRFSYLLMLVLVVGGIAAYRWARARQAAWDVEREKRMQELEAANRELESFSHTVAHDLRAPLRHISGYLDLWREDAAAAPDAGSRQYVEKIAAAAARMGRLIDDLLAFSRTARTALNKTTVELGPLVADIVAELQPDVGSRQVEWVVGSLPAVHGDRNLLRFALFNLLQNAVKYTSTRAAARIEITCAMADGDAIIAVRDNGVGFDMQYVHKLFNVFERLHGEAEFTGTGIGLANVARIVHRHGGRVWAEGETGRGAAFFVALPCKGAT